MASSSATASQTSLTGSKPRGSKAAMMGGSCWLAKLGPEASWKDLPTSASCNVWACVVGGCGHSLLARVNPQHRAFSLHSIGFVRTVVDQALPEQASQQDTVAADSLIANQTNTLQ